MFSHLSAKMAAVAVASTSSHRTAGIEMHKKLSNFMSRRSSVDDKNMRHPFPDAKDWEHHCVLELLMLDGYEIFISLVLLTSDS